MHESTIIKIWGVRKRLLILNQAEVDLLYLEKNSRCSWHFHKKKHNYFYNISAKIKIVTELGDKILNKGEHLTVLAGVKHCFEVLESGIMLEVAYVNNGNIDSNDINRQIQGGKFIKGKFYTLDELMKQNWTLYEKN